MTTNPAHGLWLEINGVKARFIDAFRLSLSLEERFGALPEFMSRGPSSFTMREIVDFLTLAAAHAETGPGDALDVAAHVSRHGRAGGLDCMAQIIMLIMSGWEGLRDAAGANPRRPAATAGYPGTTSSEPPASSDGDPSTSGAPGPSNSGP